MFRRTGEVALSQGGVYHSDCRCKVEWTIRKGERFPQCPKCKGLVGWVFTRSIYQRPAPPMAPPLLDPESSGG